MTMLGAGLAGALILFGIGLIFTDSQQSAYMASSFGFAAGAALGFLADKEAESCWPPVVVLERGAGTSTSYIID